MAGAAGIRLFLADDHPVFRKGLRRLLEQAHFTVVGDASAADVVQQAPSVLKAELLLLNSTKPDRAVEVLRELSCTASAVRTIMLSAEIHLAALLEALRLGVRGVVRKHCAAELLFSSIRAVADGQYWLDGEPLADLNRTLTRVQESAAAESAREWFGLTRRELEVIAGVIANQSNKQIALALRMSEDTVKHHLGHIFDKLGVSSRLELAVYAVHHHLAARPSLAH